MEKVIVFTKLSKNQNGDFLGEYESLGDAITELAEARNDNDYSKESFNEIYKFYDEGSLGWVMHKNNCDEEKALEIMIDR